MTDKVGDLRIIKWSGLYMAEKMTTPYWGKRLFYSWIASFGDKKDAELFLKAKRKEKGKCQIKHTR